jgi:hypothetical protein
LLRRFGVGAALFAFPLLIAIATPQGFASLGPFGRSFWIPATLAFVALMILFGAAIQLSRALRQAAAAARYGYGLSTIALVAADAPRDTGFILQSARMYAGMSPDSRKALLFTRIVGPLSYLAAALWLPFGVALAVTFAYFGAIGPRALWLLALVPTALFAICGWLVRATEGTITRRITKRWKGAASEQDPVPAEAAQWRAQFEDITSDDVPAARTPARPGPFTAAAFAVVVPAVILLVPVIAIAAATIMGPLLATIAVPHIGATEARLQAAQLFRQYAVPTDPGITPEQAGRNLVNLMHIARQDALPFEQPPTRSYEVQSAQALARPAQYRADSVAKLLRNRSFSVDDRSQLAAAVAHPAHADFALLARAGRIDVNGTRWKLPFPDSLTMWSLPIPRFGALRELAYAHVMLGYQQYLDGNTDAAERSMRETIGAGFHLIDDGVTLIEALIGRVIVMIGVNGLRAVYEASSQTAAASVLANRIENDELMQKATRRNLNLEVAQSLELLPRAVMDTALPRSLRWESFTHFHVFAPCVNLNRAVFPANAEYDRWLSQARASLVRFPADTALFNLARDQALMPKRERVFRCAAPIEMMRDILN